MTATVIKILLEMPKLSEFDWRAAGTGTPDLSNGFSMLRLTSSGPVSTHVQTKRQPVLHLCAKQGIIMSDLFQLAALFPCQISIS